MKTFSLAFLILNGLILCATRTQADSCTSFQGELQNNLPTAASNNYLQIIQNAVRTLANADKWTAQYDCDQTLYAVRYLSAILRIPEVTIATYVVRYNTIRSTSTAAIEKAQADLLGKSIAAVAARDPAVPNLDAVITATGSACTAYQTAAQAAITAGRNLLNTLIVDVTNVAVVPANNRGTLFGTCRTLLRNKRALDTILSSLQSATLNIVVNSNLRLKNCLQAVLNSVIVRINASNRVNKELDRTNANKAVSDFNPPQDETAIAAITTPLRAAALTLLDTARTASTPEEFSNAAITFCATYSQTLSDAINTSRTSVNTPYQTAVTNTNKVLAPTAP